MVVATTRIECVTVASPMVYLHWSRGHISAALLCVSASHLLVNIIMVSKHWVPINKKQFPFGKDIVAYITVFKVVCTKICKLIRIWTIRATEENHFSIFKLAGMTHCLLSCDGFLPALQWWGYTACEYYHIIG